VRSHIRPGSADLVELFLRQQREGVLLANDTSIGVGYAPLTPLESSVYHVEKHLNSPSFKDAHPALGEDVKVMGLRRDRSIELTVACAMIGCHLADLRDYTHLKEDIERTAGAIARRYATGYEVALSVNTADDPEHDSIYLTVTGTSAESGDDGEAGRGNRANGLITPYRLMTMESVAGKNPVTHVGKIYNSAAGLITEALVAEVPEVSEATCCLVSRIGKPVTEPQLTDVKVRLPDGARLAALRPRIDNIVEEHLSALPEMADRLLAGDLAFDQWPFRAAELGWITEDSDAAAERRQLLAEVEDEARLTARFTGHKSFSQRVMQALAKVPRHAFVPVTQQSLAYINAPLPIGSGQTISQPYIVALMTQLLQPREEDIVLEIGTGSGYQAAILATLVRHVYSLEIVDELAARATQTLHRLAITNVTVRTGNGYHGWPERAPFDAIIVTAAAPSVPRHLLEQLKPGGRLVIPVGSRAFGQDLLLIEKGADGQIDEKNILPVSFVPFKGEN
jgi:protein-L-isoaspartate(D-aspartate) O-methyltransferase